MAAASSPDLEDTIYACRRCGAELIRTSVRKMTKAEAPEAPVGGGCVTLSPAAQQGAPNIATTS